MKAWIFLALREAYHRARLGLLVALHYGFTLAVLATGLAVFSAVSGGTPWEAVGYCAGAAAALYALERLMF